MKRKKLVSMLMATVMMTTTMAQNGTSYSRTVTWSLDFHSIIQRKTEYNPTQNRVQSNAKPSTIQRKTEYNPTQN